MVNINNKIKNVVKSTKNKNKYTVGVYLCKYCSKEIFIGNSRLKNHGGCCRICEDKYNNKINNLKFRTCINCFYEQDICQFRTINSKQTKRVCHKCSNLKKIWSKL